MKMPHATSTIHLMKAKVAQVKINMKKTLLMKVRRMQSLHVKSRQIGKAISHRVVKKRPISRLKHHERRRFKPIQQILIKKTHTQDSPRVPNQVRTMNGVSTQNQMSTIQKIGLHSVPSSTTLCSCISALAFNGFTNYTWQGRAESLAMIWVSEKLFKFLHCSKDYSTLTRSEKS